MLIGFLLMISIKPTKTPVGKALVLDINCSISWGVTFSTIFSVSLLFQFSSTILASSFFYDIH
jgi:hypothetical protein